MRRAARLTLAGTVGLVAVLTAEVLIARRTERIEPFARAQLDGRYGPQDGEPVRVAWIGDSTAVGVGASDPAHALARLVGEGLERPVELSVLAESGARTADALADQLPMLAALEPDWVIIGIGNNDVIHLTPRPRFRRRLDQLVEGVLATGPDRVAILGVAEFAGTPLFAQPLRFIAGERADLLDRDVRAVARKHDLLFVDIKGITGPRFVGDPVRFHARDRFHPSDDGYALWAEAVLGAIQGDGW